jgi:hypothetical protein
VTCLSDWRQLLYWLAAFSGAGTSFLNHLTFFYYILFAPLGHVLYVCNVWMTALLLFVSILQSLSIAIYLISD